MSTTSTSLRAFTSRPRPGNFVAARETSKYIAGLSKTEAEDLLDWLEANGRSNFELTCSENGFAVWYR